MCEFLRAPVGYSFFCLFFSSWKAVYGQLLVINFVNIGYHIIVGAYCFNVVRKNMTWWIAAAIFLSSQTV